MIIAGFDVASALRAADGFPVGGDAVVTRNVGDQLLLAVVDVLGHGPQAHAQALRAEALLTHTACTDPAALLTMLDHTLAGTIGAAAGIAVVQPETGIGRYVGIGNTVARIFGPHERRLVSVDGIVGQSHRSPLPAEFLLAPDDLLLLHTDGISSRFAGPDYPQLLTEDPFVSSRELIRRFGKPYDDAACIVIRRPTP